MGSGPVDRRHRYDALRRRRNPRGARRSGGSGRSSIPGLAEDGERRRRDHLGGVRRYRGSWPKASSSTSAAKSGRAAGNGSLMRTLPVALAYPDRGRMLRQAARISAMTHWDSQAEVCCAVYCLWITELLAGASLRDGWIAALELGNEWADREQADTDTAGPRALPSGFWDDSMPSRRFQSRGFSRTVATPAMSSTASRQSFGWSGRTRIPRPL